MERELKKKILFIVLHRKDRSPGQRFRHEQYISYLEENGFSCIISALLDEKSDEIFYSKGNFIKKILILIKTISIRRNDFKKAKDVDAIFIYREAISIWSVHFEKKFKKEKKKIIFDFDDSVWLKNVSNENKHFSWIKNAAKTSKIIALSDVVIAGNPYLANYALEYNKNVSIFPTTIDTEEYQREKNTKSEKIIIGWSGSITTIQHFNFAVPILKKIQQKFNNSVIFKVIGDGNFFNQELNIKGIAWDKKTEISELSTFDIGIMPLPDSEWTKGKCGLKGLQYMALEIPTIMSPVGVNTEIINDGENGFLASNEDEWVEKLSLLIENHDLREKLGKAGRKTVEEKYSVKANYQKYLDLFK